MRMPSAVRPCRRTAWQRGASVLRVIIRSTAALLIFGAVPLAHAAGPAAATAGTNIGNAAQLTTSATGTITSGSDDWRVIYPQTPGEKVTVTIQNNGSPSCAIEAKLDSTNGADENLVAAEIQPGASGQLQRSAFGSDRYYVEVEPFDCSSSAPYKITLNAGGGGKPPDPAHGSIAAGTSIGDAWPPLQGHTTYPATLANQDSGDWYVLYKKPGTALASIRVQDATVAGPGSCAIAVTLYNTDGANGPISGHDIQVNGSATFSVPGSETIDPQGRYFLQVQGFDCGTGGADYTIEPEPAAQWASPARPASRLLPGGPRKAAAGGPLVGSVHYRGSLVTATSRQWTYFQVNGLTPVTVHAEDTTLGGDSCEAITVTLQNAKGSTVDAAQLGDNGASSMRVARAGTYLLRLTVAEECSPSAPVNAIVFLAPARGLRGPVLKVSDLTLPQGVAHRAYRAPIKIAGRVTRRAFTAETALPPGLRLNSKTGVITGKPTIAGKYTFLVKITDSAKPHHSVTDLFQLTIS